MRSGAEAEAEAGRGRRGEEWERLEGGRQGWFLPSERLPGGAVPTGGRVSAETSPARSGARASGFRGAHPLGLCRAAFLWVVVPWGRS